MDTINSLVKNTLALLSVEFDCSIDELFNFLLTGYDPETKFSKTRLEILDVSMKINKRQVELHAKDEQITDEQVEQLAARVTQQLTSTLLSEGRNVNQWEGATPIAEHACLFVTGNTFNVENVIWLHNTVGYAVLLN